MATHRIVLLITDEEIEALADTRETLDEIASGYEAYDYHDELETVNNLHAYLTGILERIEMEVLAQ